MKLNFYLVMIRSMMSDVEHFLPKIKAKFKKENTAVIRPLHSCSPMKISYDKTIIPDCMEYYKDYMNNEWSDKEHNIFVEQSKIYKKKFDVIADKIPRKSYGDCVLHYYLTKPKKSRKKTVIGLQKKSGASRSTLIERLKCGSGMMLNSIINSDKIITRARLKLNNCENEENESNPHLVNTNSSKKPTNSSNKSLKRKLVSKDPSEPPRKSLRHLASSKDNNLEKGVSNIEVIEVENGKKVILPSSSNHSFEEQTIPLSKNQQQTVPPQSTFNSLLDNLIDDMNDGNTTSNKNESLIEDLNYNNMDSNKAILQNNIKKDEHICQISEGEIIDLTADTDDEDFDENQNVENILERKEIISLHDADYYEDLGFVSMQFNKSSPNTL